MTDTDGRNLIELWDLQKIYRVGTELVHALRGLTVGIASNEYVAIMGPSGSGKSTLMNILGCLDVPTRGSYYLRGADVSKMSQSRLARIRGRQIGFVFQTFELLPRTTALKNVQLPLMYTQGSHKRQRAMAALERVGLSDRAKHRPNQLSGGQKQRVAIARALVQEPDIILADEPTGNLDSTTGNEIMNVFDVLHGEGQTILIVTHEEHVAARCRRVIRLMDGRIESDVRTDGSDGQSVDGLVPGIVARPLGGTPPVADAGDDREPGAAADAGGDGPSAGTNESSVTPASK